MQKPVTFKKIY